MLCDGGAAKDAGTRCDHIPGRSAPPWARASPAARPRRRTGGCLRTRQRRMPPTGAGIQSRTARTTWRCAPGLRLAASRASGAPPRPGRGAAPGPSGAAGRPTPLAPGSGAGPATREAPTPRHPWWLAHRYITAPTRAALSAYVAAAPVRPRWRPHGRRHTTARQRGGTSSAWAQRRRVVLHPHVAAGQVRTAAAPSSFVACICDATVTQLLHALDTGQEALQRRLLRRRLPVAAVAVPKVRTRGQTTQQPGQPAATGVPVCARLQHLTRLSSVSCSPWQGQHRGEGESGPRGHLPGGGGLRVRAGGLEALRGLPHRGGNTHGA